MKIIYQKIYNNLPTFIQSLLISFFNYRNNKLRYGKNYNDYKLFFESNHNKELSELKELQRKRLIEFIHFAYKNSNFYKVFYRDVDMNSIKTIEDLTLLPILTKELIRNNICDIATINKNDAYIQHTGGTTGKSLEVLFKPEDLQERWGCLDSFRGRYGYSLGKKTAWLTGKTIISEKDIKKKKFWKTDYLYKVRYYSTFHVNIDTIPFYLENLKNFKPEYISGFPSTIYDLAKYIQLNNLKIKLPLKAIFVTAEAISSEQKLIIERSFNAKVYNQYASSEGAPYIFECSEGNMHEELLSGVIEIIDNKGNKSDSGEILVTSFSTQGTPLIRYKIGDRMTRSIKKCKCGTNLPIISSIEGRNSDYIFSKERGKVSIINFANSVKLIKGIIKFQIIQDNLEMIKINIVSDSNIFTIKDKKIFDQEIRDRLGSKIKIEYNFIDEIKNEKSGKFRMIKNNITAEIDKFISAQKIEK